MSTITFEAAEVDRSRRRQAGAARRYGVPEPHWARGWDLQMARDLRIDTLRGLALVVISWHHLPFPVRQWGKDVFGFFSFFEVFVFLSGLVAGIVYTATYLRDPSASLWGKALRRAGVIYATQLLVLTCIVGMWAVWQDSQGRLNMRTDGLLETGGPLLSWLYGLFLLYQPGLSNVLALYVLLLPLTPIAVGAVVGGRGPWLLGASFAVWAFAQTIVAGSLGSAFESALGHRVGDMPPLAWQLLFVGGVWLGVRRALGRQLPSTSFAWSLALLGLWLVLVAAAHGWLPDGMLSSWIESHADRRRLEPVRVLNFALVAWFTAAAAQRWPRAFEIGWLAHLGQHSLQVFAFSAIVVYPLRLLAPASLPVQLGVGVALVASLAIPASLHARYRSWRERSRMTRLPLDQGVASRG